MRRIVLLATPLLLGGCAGSGFYAYLGNTFTLPFGANPNAAPGGGENYAKVRARADQPPAPILFEAGDVWPPPPQPPMTLKDLQAQQTQEMKSSGETGGYAPLQPLPQLPGYEVPQQQSHPTNPGAIFPSGGIPRSGAGAELKAQPGDGTIVVPNGNGTSTVIAPNGSVTTIKTPGK